MRLKDSMEQLDSIYLIWTKIQLGGLKGYYGSTTRWGILKVTNNQKTKSTRDYSKLQEEQIAKFLGGRVQSNSGGTIFGGGDVHTQSFFIEAKTPTKLQTGFTIKKEWMDKLREQAFEQNKPYSALAFRFDPDDSKDLYVIDARTFLLLTQYIEEENK